MGGRKLAPMTTTDRPAKTRWVWIRERDGGRVLAFQYVDPVAGPSAKGARVGEPPSADDVRRAVDRPDRTFRQPRQFSAMPVRPDEASARRQACPISAGSGPTRTLVPSTTVAGRSVFDRSVRQGTPSTVVSS